MKTKKCFKCHIEKPKSEFYAHPMMADGRLGKCKECTKTDVREHYAKTRDERLRYERLRSADASRKRQVRKNNKAWMARNQPKVAAMRSAHRAIKNGLLTRPSVCSRCAKACAPDGHHRDYSKPLDVEWLCRSCHRREHA